MSALQIILCIFLPPVAVFMKKNAFDKDVIINLVLWIVLCGIGGVVHAFVVCSKK